MEWSMFGTTPRGRWAGEPIRKTTRIIDMINGQKKRTSMDSESHQMESGLEEGNRTAEEAHFAKVKR